MVNLVVATGNSGGCGDDIDFDAHNFDKGTVESVTGTFRGKALSEANKIEVF